MSWFVRTLPDTPTEALELGALAPHANRIRAAAADALAPNTRRAYRGAWERFRTWAGAEGLRALPTLRMDRQAIRAAHVEAGEPDPAASEGVRRVLRGLSRRRTGEGRR